MATPLENLKTRRQNVTDELAAWLANKVSYAIDGQSVQWESGRMSLIQELKELNELINIMDPFELPTIMV